MSEQDTEVVETAEEVVEQPETVEQPEAKDTSEIDSLVEKVLPELAGDYKNLDPAARERILLKRLAQSEQSRAAKGDDSNEPSPTAGTEAATAPVVEIPPLDRSKWATDFKSAMRKAIEDGDVDGADAPVAQIFDYVDAHMRLVVQAMSEQSGVTKSLRDELNDLSAPRQFAQALEEVPKATDADIKAAQRLMKSGEAKTHKAALKLAVYERLTSGTPDTGAPKRRAVDANRMNLEPGGGEPADDSWPQTEEEWVAYRKKEAEARRKK